jgi:hypothetical protein
MVSRNGAEGADYWQCAFVIRKGDVEETQRNGIEDLRVGIVEIAPFLRDRGTEFRDWSDLKLLTVRVDSPAAVVSPTPSGICSCES